MLKKLVRYGRSSKSNKEDTGKNSNDENEPEDDVKKLTKYYKYKHDTLYYDIKDKKSSKYNYPENANDKLSQKSEHDNPKKKSKSKIESTGRDWNAEFQSLLDSEDIHEKAVLLGKFGSEFVQEVSKTVQTIVDEHGLPDSKRTIPPADIGGIAGGTKFVHNGIVYKMAVDDLGLYHCDESAIKVASHEFRGAIWMSIFKGFRVPLSCLVDYCGMRITALAKLPISSDTLVYGSNDAGTNIHNEDAYHFQTVVRMMTDVRKMMLWRAVEITERSSNTKKTMIGPVDLEIHYGKDARFYAVDTGLKFDIMLTVTARVFPPVSPTSFTRRQPVSYLVNLFRQEFRELAAGLLIPDAYSPFCKEGKEDVEQFTKNLLNSLRISAELLDMYYKRKANPNDVHQARIEKLLNNIDIATWFHAHGFNLRYLGYFYVALRADELKGMILTEMVARTLKDDLKKRLREVVKMDMKKRLQTAQEFFNEVFDPINYSTDYWNGTIKELMQHKYDGPFSQEEMDKLDIRQRINLGKVFQSVQQKTGIHVVSKNAPSTLNSNNVENNIDWNELFPVSTEQVQMFIICKHRASACNSYAEKLKQLSELLEGLNIEYMRGFVNYLMTKMMAISLGAKPQDYYFYVVDQHAMAEKLNHIREWEITRVYEKATWGYSQ